MKTAALATIVLMTATGCRDSAEGPVSEGAPVAAPAASEGTKATSQTMASRVSLGEFEGPLPAELNYVFRERFPEWSEEAPVSTLEFSPAPKDGKGFILALAYSGIPAQLQLGRQGSLSIMDLSVSGAQWHSLTGTATIHPRSAEGTLRIDFSGIVLENLANRSEIWEIKVGYISGRVSRSCYVLRTRSVDPKGTMTGVNGKPLISTEHVIDEDWSSPFCASVKGSR